MLLSDTVHIWREPAGDYYIDWQTSQPDTRVAVEALGEAGAETRYRGEESPGVRASVSGLPLHKRHVFRLQDQHGNEVQVPERRLGLEGSPNFRDFGGYRTVDGQYVRWGFLYRSGHLARLSERDVQLLDSLNLDLVFDFRRESECEQEPSRLPRERPPQVHNLPIQPGNNSGLLEQMNGRIPGPEVMFEFMVTVNRELASHEAPVYRRMFETILAADDARYLVHCAAGKDRTGFAVALMLMALGVPEETILRDYLLTRRFYDAQAEVLRAQLKYGLTDSDGAAVLPMLEVDEAYLGEALQHIRDRHPSKEHYLETVMGLGPAQLAELRRRYLSPEPLSL